MCHESFLGGDQLPYRAAALAIALGKFKRGKSKKENQCVYLKETVGGDVHVYARTARTHG